MHDIAIIIVSYNTRDLLRSCLQSVYDGTGGLSAEVYVVDNRSRDGSADMVRTEFPQVRLIENETNSGYASANNIALRQYDARYALLLNADTLLPRDALSNALSFMDAHPDAGVMTAKLVRSDGSLDKACRRSFPTPWIAFARLSGLNKLFPKNPRFSGYNLDHVDPDTLIEVDAVAGAFMLIRREALEQAGLLDETFFAFGEDLDISHGRSHFHHGLMAMAVGPDNSGPDIYLGELLLDSQNLHFSQLSNAQDGVVGEDQFSSPAFVCVKSLFCPNGGVWSDLHPTFFTFTVGQYYLLQMGDPTDEDGPVGRLCSAYEKGRQKNCPQYILFHDVSSS